MQANTAVPAPATHSDFGKLSDINFLKPGCGHLVAQQFIHQPHILRMRAVDGPAAIPFGAKLRIDRRFRQIRVGACQRNPGLLDLFKNGKRLVFGLGQFWL
jgi:hypothetical protein